MKIMLDQKQIAEFSAPIVYIFRLGDEALYIGKGCNISRPFQPYHHAREARQLADSLEIICCASHVAAFRLESELINSLSPRYNHAMPRRLFTTAELRRAKNAVKVYRRPQHEVKGDFTDPSTGKWITFKR